MKLTPEELAALEACAAGERPDFNVPVFQRLKELGLIRDIPTGNPALFITDLGIVWLTTIRKEVVFQPTKPRRDKGPGS